MIKFVDANIFIKRWSDPDAEAFINSLNHENYSTSVLVLAEVYHKMKQKRISAAFEYVRSLMGALTVFDITKNDLFKAMKNSVDLNINDKIHVETMKRNNVHTIVSFDNDFDRVKAITREEV
ncbi:type II toxin-antitoxin system VapC family toxin [Candidatus Woesearchaeota archaeon]|nr:type II toxin-antitoxin system VapC family toxin [Candidatus Woesearchaeota archaeon]